MKLDTVSVFRDDFLLDNKNVKSEKEDFKN